MTIMSLQTIKSCKKRVAFGFTYGCLVWLPLAKEEIIGQDDTIAWATNDTISRVTNDTIALASNDSMDVHVINAIYW